MTYLQFLTLLASLGAKLPAVLAALQALADWYKTYVVPLLPAASRKLKAAKAPTAKELKAESAVVAAMKLHGPRTRAIGDGSILKAIRSLWDFIQANPALLAWILKLIAV